MIFEQKENRGFCSSVFRLLCFSLQLEKYLLQALSGNGPAGLQSQERDYVLHVRCGLFQTYLVGAGSSSLREAIKLFWTFRVPWGWTYTAGTVADWVAQFSFGFYSLMLTSLLLGLIVMVLYKPRTWCTFCPMGTMTQGICKLKNNEKK